jgi:chromate reductase
MASSFRWCLRRDTSTRLPQLRPKCNTGHGTMLVAPRSSLSASSAKLRPDFPRPPPSCARISRVLRQAAPGWPAAVVPTHKRASSNITAKLDNQRITRTDTGSRPDDQEEPPIMTDQPRILAFAGSARKDSFNVKLVNIAAAGARGGGRGTRPERLSDATFNQDLEAADGAPPQASRLKEIMRAHGGLLIASPEYNSSISPLLKNTIDWVSRPADGEPMLAAYQGKVAGLMSASPGRLGGLRGLVHLRSILSNIGVHVIPDQVTVGEAGSAFDDRGDLVDDRRRASVQGVGRTVTTLVGWNR